jgi:hypothetical protein
MKKKQVWCKSIKSEPVKHEYDIYTSEADDVNVTTIHSSATSEFNFAGTLGILTESGDGFEVTINGVNQIKFEIDYSDAEVLLALLSSVYDTTMEIRVAETITKIN